MKKILSILVLISMIGLATVLLLNNARNQNVVSEKITIIATLFPQYDFAKIIGGDKTESTLLLPPGVEAHAYELKPSDITKINNADIFVYTGEFMEPWAHDIILSADKKVHVVDVSSGVTIVKDESEHETDTDHETEEHHEDKHSHEHGGIDPHIWLDFTNAQIMAENIAKALIKVDPKNTKYYQNNLNEYQSKLTDLDNRYKKTLSVCRSRTIIYGGHYAFGYLAKKYGLNYVSAQGFSPDSEPTAQDMIALTEQIRKENINYIYYEELTSPKIAETLARETKTKLLLLNGAHNLSKEDYEEKATFISLMEENLGKLSTGLNCN